MMVAALLRVYLFHVLLCVILSKELAFLSVTTTILSLIYEGLACTRVTLSTRLAIPIVFPVTTSATSTTSATDTRSLCNLVILLGSSSSASINLLLFLIFNLILGSISLSVATDTL